MVIIHRVKRVVEQDLWEMPQYYSACPTAGMRGLREESPTSDHGFIPNADQGLSDIKKLQISFRLGWSGHSPCKMCIKCFLGWHVLGMVQYDCRGQGIGNCSFKRWSGPKQVRRSSSMKWWTEWSLFRLSGWVLVSQLLMPTFSHLALTGSHSYFPSCQDQQAGCGKTLQED